MLVCVRNGRPVSSLAVDDNVWLSRCLRSSKGDSWQTRFSYIGNDPNTYDGSKAGGVSSSFRSIKLEERDRALGRYLREEPRCNLGTHREGR